MKLQLKIEQDEYPESPREWDNLGTIYYWKGSRYILGDEALSREELKEIEEDESLYSLPVYAYIHSGITLNTTGFSCPWDSGQCGVIAVSEEKVEKEGVTDRVYDILRSEVEYFSKYLNGDVTGWAIYEGETHLDSCWGYYDLDQCREAGEEALAYWQERRANEAALIYQEEIGETA